MLQLAIEIGSYSIKGLAQDSIKGKMEKHTIEIPSWCAFEDNDSDGNVYLGHAAKMCRLKGFAYQISYLENPDESFRRIIRKVVCDLIEWANHWFPNAPVYSVHFLVPMYYKENNPLIEDMRQVADSLGFKKVFFIPAHIALCKSQAEVNNRETVLVYDLGYRGLTVSLLRKMNYSNYELVCPSVFLADCAGKQIDSELMKDLLRDNPISDLSTMMLLEDTTVYLKEFISIHQQCRCVIPGTNFFSLIDRNVFNDKITPIVTKSLTFTRDFINELTEPPTAVLLWGGTSRLPIVKNRFLYLANELNLPTVITDCSRYEGSPFYALEGSLIADGTFVDL